MHTVLNNYFAQHYPHSRMVNYFTYGARLYGGKSVQQDGSLTLIISHTGVTWYWLLGYITPMLTIHSAYIA